MCYFYPIKSGTEIIMELGEFFRAVPKAALGLSGGTDSSLLLYEGTKLGADIRPYFIKTAFQPAFELEDAKKICGICRSELHIIELDVLSAPRVAENPADRCYYCKTALFSALRARALEDGYTVLIDGTNASDDAGDRPGMRALGELSVRSPLRECGITKDAVREMSRQAGLFTADKPSYACLATRVPSGEAITPEKLQKVERAESFLFGLGFTDLRVRLAGDAARLQFRREQMFEAVSKWDEIKRGLKDDFSTVVMDMKGRP
jgi:uncharacterized protein